MKRQLLGIAVGIVGITVCAQAQTVNNSVNNYNTPEEAQTAPPDDDHWHHWDHQHLYHNNEFSVDLFGVGVLHGSDFDNGARARHNLRGGGGAGINLFFNRFVGIGGDAYAVSFHHSFVDTTTGNLILRFPIPGTGLAPYIFGGAGYQFAGIDQVVGGGGGGLELRVVHDFSFFVDARYLAAAKTDGYGVGRAGVRLVF